MQDTDGNVIDTELRFLNISQEENDDFLTPAAAGEVRSLVNKCFGSSHCHIHQIMHNCQFLCICHCLTACIVIAFVIFSVVSNLLKILKVCLIGYSPVLG